MKLSQYFHTAIVLEQAGASQGIEQQQKYVTNIVGLALSYLKYGVQLRLKFYSTEDSYLKMN